MTLILTEISDFGIAMAADSAVTIPVINAHGDHQLRVLTGVKKLQVIEKLNAGISIWGLAELTIEHGQKIDTDIWLRDFIQSERPNYNSLSEFAILLQNRIRNYVNPIDPIQRPLGNIGFHLAGFVEHEGHQAPTFYHIHNGVSKALEARGTHIDPTIVNANHDLPPNIAQERLAQNQIYLTRNGDFSIYAALFNHIVQFLASLSEYGGITIPQSRNLSERAEWLRFQIRTMSELYRLSNLRLPTIGGKIDTLLITSDGIDTCGLTF
jgi:hypothetical protein